MASIRWTVGAHRDLKAVVEFIAQDSPVYAAATASRIWEAVQRLKRYPSLGRMVPEYRDSSIRELLVGNYRVVYQVSGKRVGIVAIVHSSQDLLRRKHLQET